MAMNVDTDGDHESDSDYVAADDGDEEDRSSSDSGSAGESASDSDSAGESAADAKDESGDGVQTLKQKTKAKYADLKQRIAALSPRGRGKPLTAYAAAL